MAQDLRGRWMWYELMTSDPTAAARFYLSTLGWTTAPFDGIDVPYALWMNGERPIGGVMALAGAPSPVGAVPAWLIYVGSDDLDGTVRLAERLGARTLLAPADMPKIGRVAILADPQGATFALHQPPEPPPHPETDPAVGDVSWHELATTDAVAAGAFYRELFGWEDATTYDMGPLGRYHILGRNGRQWIGMFDKAPEMPGPSWCLYARVADVSRTVQQIKDAGGQLLNGPMEVPGGDVVAQCLDPQGAAFAIHEKRP